MDDGGGHILVVDDHRTNRLKMSMAVKSLGHTVALAEDGLEALDLLRAEPFDLVLLDIIMPIMDGYQVLAEMKADPDLRDIPVIVISAAQEMDSVVKGIELGAEDYLPKTFDPVLLKARVDTCLEKKRHRDQELEYLRQVDRLTDAASAVETATFEPEELVDVAERSDELGRLARVFQNMAHEVHLREQRLKQQLQQLRLDMDVLKRDWAEPISVYMPMDRRQAIVRGESLPSRAQGAALFADISGFTPLAEALVRELGSQRGAEELPRHLNRVYDAVIAQVHRYGGSVLGFSGDAVTCWLDERTAQADAAPAGLRAMACGLAIQKVMAQFGAVTTPAGTAFQLSIKVAAVTGPVRRFLVGNPAIQIIEAIAGRTLDELAAAEQCTRSGQVLVPAAMVEAAGGLVEVEDWRHSEKASPELVEGTRQRYAIVAGLSEPVPPLPWPDLPPDRLRQGQCRPWLLPSVYERARTGTQQFLSELRTAAALFLKFGGIDFDDEEAGAKLDAYIRWVQAVIDRHGGSLLQLSIGEKGSYLYAVFGAPLAHADDPVRAAYAALELAAPPPDLGFIGGVQIGLTRGQMRAGAYGGGLRRTYGVLGPKTNLAARLMQAAGPPVLPPPGEKMGNILCEASICQAAQTYLAFDELPPIKVRGKEGPVAVYRLGAEKEGVAHAQFGLSRRLRIISRIDRLPPAEQLALKVASVVAAGDDACAFERDLVRDVYPLRSDRPRLDEYLARLEEEKLIQALEVSPEPRGLAYCFQSAIVRETAYNSMLFVQRRYLHRLIAEWYERTVGADPSLADIPPAFFAALAHHWQQAEEPGRAGDCLERAGQQALQQDDPEGAERFFEASLALETQAAVLSAGYLAAEKLSPSLIDWTEEFDVMPEENYAEQLAESQQAAERAAAAYDWQTAQRLYTEALELLSAAEIDGLPPETVYELRAGRAACHEGQGDYAAALPDLETMVHLAKELDDAPRRITALNRQAEVCLNTGDLAEGQRLAKTALNLARQITDPPEVGQQLRVDSLTTLGRLVDAPDQTSPGQEYLETVLDLVRELYDEILRRKEYFEVLFQSNPVAVVTIDNDAAVTSWNPAAEKLFGYTKSEALGQNVDDLVANSEEIREEAVGYSRVGLDTDRDVVQAITKRTRKDGLLVDVELSGVPIIVQGEKLGMYALYHDISELRKARHDAIAAKEYFEVLFQSNPVAVVAIDTDAAVTSWNPAAEKLFGYTAGETLGQNVDDLVAKSEEVYEEAVDISRVGLETSIDAVQLITKRTRKDGSLVDVELSGVPIIVQGEKLGMYALYHDISELQKARHDAIAAKEYFEVLFQSNPVAVLTIDNDAAITAWNPAAEELFGYTEAEALGQNVDDLVANSEEIREEAVGYSRVGLDTDCDVFQAITKRTRKDGSLVDVELSGVPIIVQGEKMGMYGMYHDISELQKARHDAIAANEAKSTFLATMSHEIRTPMNAVIGMTSLLLDTPLNEEQHDYAETIRASGDALLAIINDILDFSKVEAGKLELEMQPFDLRGCIQEALDLLAPKAAEKGLDLAYLIAPDTPEAIVGDVTRLRQIMINLLNNALKFTEKGEVVVSVQCGVGSSDHDPPTTDHSSLTTLHFSVRDTGIGIPPDRMDRLFEAFSQVDASTTRKYGGTGLGLAISQRLSELMGGEIWVESEVGVGTTFHFTIQAEPAPSTAYTYLHQVQPQLQGRRLLIVDDNNTNRLILTRQAEAWGMAYRDTASPRQALEWLRAGEQFDLAVLDMRMPEMDGLSLATEIRRLEQGQDKKMPLVMFSSAMAREVVTREEYEQAQFAAFLNKPLKPAQMFDTVATILTGEPTRISRTQAARDAGFDETMGQTWPLRILLAEDHPINQKLTQLILGRLGYRADLACNGLEAVQAVGRQPYDVVLMDMQMPEMDGLEATRQIRQKWPGEAGPHIIAITANVMPGDRGRCFEAGMDDFVPKPIRIEALVEALRKASSSRTKGVGAQPVPPYPRPLSPEGEGRAGVRGGGLIYEAEAPETQILDPGALEILLGVVGGDEAMLRELIDSLLHDAPPLLADLRRALAQDDAAGIRRAAHTLKSSGSDFGATVLAGLCQELEDMVREGRLTSAAGYVQRIEGEYAQVQEALGSVDVRGGEIVVHHNVAHQEVALPSLAQGEPGAPPVEAATVEQKELPSPESPAQREGPTQAVPSPPPDVEPRHVSLPQPVTTLAPVAPAQANGPGRAPLLPRGIRTLADLIGHQPHLLEELLDDLLAEKPERADALEQWIAELDAWHRSRPRLRKA